MDNWLGLFAITVLALKGGKIWILVRPLLLMVYVRHLRLFCLIIASAAVFVIALAPAVFGAAECMEVYNLAPPEDLYNPTPCLPGGAACKAYARKAKRNPRYKMSDLSYLSVNKDCRDYEICRSSDYPARICNHALLGLDIVTGCSATAVQQYYSYRLCVATGGRYCSNNTAIQSDAMVSNILNGLAKYIGFATATCDWAEVVTNARRTRNPNLPQVEKFVPQNLLSFASWLVQANRICILKACWYLYDPSNAGFSLLQTVAGGQLPVLSPQDRQNYYDDGAKGYEILMKPFSKGQPVKVPTSSEYPAIIQNMQK